MNNKTSDKNVANIEDDIKLVKRYLENSAYKETDSDFFKNGGWEMVDLEIPKAMANILAEREQKDKRIQELEEELGNSIPKQAVIDKIEEYDKKMEEDAGHPNWVITDRIVMNVLQELLEGERK